MAAPRSALSDFRVHHGDKLDRLLTELLAALMKAGVITLRTVAQDGTRVRVPYAPDGNRGRLPWSRVS